MVVLAVEVETVLRLVLAVLVIHLLFLHRKVVTAAQAVQMLALTMVAAEVVEHPQ